MNFEFPPKTESIILVVVASVPIVCGLLIALSALGKHLEGTGILVLMFVCVFCFGGGAYLIVQATDRQSTTVAGDQAIVTEHRLFTKSVRLYSRADISAIDIREERAFLGSEVFLLEMRTTDSRVHRIAKYRSREEIVKKKRVIEHQIYGS